MANIYKKNPHGSDASIYIYKTIWYGCGYTALLKVEITIVVYVLFINVSNFNVIYSLNVTLPLLLQYTVCISIKV